MKKIFSVILAAALLFSVAAVSASAAGTDYKAYDAIHASSSPTSDPVWHARFTTDGGKTFQDCTVKASGFGDPAYEPDDSTYYGIGVNADAVKIIPNTVELNADNGSTGAGALTFIAPADGSYTINAFSVYSVWGGQDGTLNIAVNGAVKGTYAVAAPADNATGVSDATSASVPAATYTLKAGDKIDFFPTVGANWTSLYVAGLTITKAAAAGGASNGGAASHNGGAGNTSSAVPTGNTFPILPIAAILVLAAAAVVSVVVVRGRRSVNSN